MRFCFLHKEIFNEVRNSYDEYIGEYCEKCVGIENDIARPIKVELLQRRA